MLSSVTKSTDLLSKKLPLICWGTMAGQFGNLQGIKGKGIMQTVWWKKTGLLTCLLEKELKERMGEICIVADANGNKNVITVSL